MLSKNQLSQKKRFTPKHHNYSSRTIIKLKNVFSNLKENVIKKTIKKKAKKLIASKFLKKNY